MKLFIRISFVVIVFVAVCLLGVFLWLRTSLPQIDGTVTVAGLSTPVTIARDKNGVPHITGDTMDDIAFGIGYAHAQDRLWQMQINRRAGYGRLSEILGSGTVQTDKYMRTLGIARKARSAYENSAPHIQAQLQRYADGVNAYIKTHAGTLSPSFHIIETRPEPWTPVDTLVWQKLMWLDLSGNMRHEIARARLLTKFTPDQVATIYPAYPGQEHPFYPAMAEIYKGLDLDAIAQVIGEEPPVALGSNNWVINGSNTKSGSPLLANDPHLGLTTPSIWYLARFHIASTGKNVVGVTFPGSPAIILGRNDTIAWGVTNTGPDIQDTYLEKLVGNDEYLTPDGTEKLNSRTEVIKVKDEADITITVRETRHGPIISDVVSDTKDFLKDGYALSLQWVAIEDVDSSIQTFAELYQAENFEEFVTIGQTYMGPQQNMVYADTEGNIGYHAPAKVPVRHPDNRIKGKLPSPGWLDLYDWLEYIPISDVPKRYNPPGGAIATANEKIVTDDYPYFITDDWALPYRGNRIRAELAATSDHTLKSFKDLHFDQVSDFARDILPAMDAVLNGSPLWANSLKDWDGLMGADMAEPLIFQTFLNNFQAAVLADDFGTLYKDYRRIRPQLLKSILHWSADNGTAHDADIPAYYALPLLDRDASLAWCGDAATCTTLALRAFNKAFDDLNALYGADRNNWKWGTAHFVRQDHRPFSNVPTLRSFFELKAPAGGGRYTVNVAGASSNPDTLHQMTHGPSYRGIFDLSDLNKSLYILPTGQSGNPLSHHYDDQFKLWQKGEYITISTATKTPPDAVGVLTLSPEESQNPE